MDSQHRHELETNSLAKALVETGEKLAPYRQAIVIGGIAAIALVVIASMAMRGNSADSDGWQSYAAAAERRDTDLEALLSTADVYAGTPVSELSRITWADAKLFEAMQQYFTNKPASNEAIAEAKEAYEKLLKADNKIIAQRAKFGLARVAEAEGKATEALEAYKAIESGPFATAAAARVTALEEKEAESQLKWLVTAQAISSGLPAGFDQQMNFGADDIELPDAGPTSEEAFSDMLNNLPQLPVRENELTDPPTNEGAASETVEEVSKEEEGTDEVETTEQPAVEAGDDEPKEATLPADEPADDVPATDEPADDE